MLEIPQDHQDWQVETLTISLNIQGVRAKECQTEEEPKTLILEALSFTNLSATRARAYTDRSAEDAVRNGGRVFVKLPNGSTISKSDTLGLQSKLKKLKPMLSLQPRPQISTTDFWPIQFFWLPVHQAASSHQDRSKSSLTSNRSFPSNRTPVILQRIPSTCGVGGNEERWHPKSSSLHIWCPTAKQRQS